VLKQLLACSLAVLFTSGDKGYTWYVYLPIEDTFYKTFPCFGMNQDELHVAILPFYVLLLMVTEVSTCMVNT
jgi:hypothetical protein